MLTRLAATSFKRLCSPAPRASPRSPYSSPSPGPPPIWGALVDMSLKPDFGPNDIDFPPLPDIKDFNIRKQVFTHRSLHGRPTHLFEDNHDDLSPDNEKYELLGDSVLGLTTTKLLLDLYPGLHVGPTTKVKAIVVGNATLSEISLRYKLPNSLRLHQAQAITLRSSQNIQADVFEVNALDSKNIGIAYTLSLNTQSFVGGLYLDQGFVAVTTWLEKLLTPYSKAAYQIIRRQHGLSAIPITPCSTHPGGKTADRNGHQNDGAFDDAPTAPVGGHLSLFNQFVQKRNDRVEWKFSDREEDKAKEDESTVKERKVTPFWSAKVLVNGEDYGQGKGTSKRAAKSEAAKQGLHKLGVVVI